MQRNISQNSGYAKKNGKWPVAQNLPKRLPGCSGGAVRSEPLRGEEQRQWGRQDPPEIVRGNLPPPGWDAVCTCQVIPLSSFLFWDQDLAVYYKLSLICAYSTCHMLVIRQYALIFNKYLFGLKSKSLSWKVHSKRYF